MVLLVWKINSFCADINLRLCFFIVKRAADEVSSEAKKPRIEVKSFRLFHQLST